MQSTFQFTLPNKKRRYYFVFAAILLLANLVFYFGYAWVQVQADESDWWSGLLIPAIALVLAAMVIRRQYGNRDTLFMLYISAAGLWVVQQQYLPAAAMAVLGTVFYWVDKDFRFRFDEQGVFIDTIPPRNYQWKDLQNVVLKDGLLTIDRKDNKIFQVDVSEAKIGVSEIEMNNFFTSHIHL
jgi:hypothetical protein